MPAPLFRLVCPPSALTGPPAGWAVDLLRDGEVAVAVGDEGLDALDELARTLGVTAVPVLRRGADDAAREANVREHAGALALVWIAPSFSDDARAWATARGPMTLLVEADGALPEDERRRIGRFVAILGGQAA
ncbi:hypothetical protein [Patulibacter sp. SYSU D01012]|uniref:hypothetical protein n=1 Tax=Patulibacter sp. SYSU D01012 TaxID=2817381 RepID=UPI001B300EA8|nr:hypothetical protein [Patulibacter sp. SYSU D01012]